MYIKELHISAFGPITDADFTFGRGLNIIEGENESGKSAIASFIKFIFYGLSARGLDRVSEKQRYINWERGCAAGYAVCEVEEAGEVKTVRIERTLSAKSDAEGKTKYSEKLKVLDHETSMPLGISSQPGDFFFGVPEGVFAGTAFASQEGSIKPDGSSLKESIENIICAADENINIKRASDVLDRARIKLLHKNRTGGEIRELERRRDELEARMMSSRETSANLIRSEISLSDVKENISGTKARRAELEELERAIVALDAGSKVEKLVSLESKLEQSRAQLNAENDKSLGESFMSGLALAVRDIERAQKYRDELALKEESARESFGTSERDPALDLSDARRSLARANAFFYTGIVLLVLGLFGIVGSALTYFLAHSTMLPWMCATFAVVVAGTGVMVASAVSRRKYFSLLDVWDVEDDDELESLAADAMKMYEELDSCRIALASAGISAMEAEDTITSLAASHGINTEGASTQSLIKQLAKLGSDSAQRKKALETEISRTEGQIAESVASLGGASREDIVARAAEVKDSEFGARAAEMSDAEKSEISRELIFNKTKMENLRDRELDLERECAALRATSASPATDAEELETIRGELERLRKTHDALVLAGETLASAGERIRLSVVPRLSSEISRIMAKVSLDRYSSLGISPSFDMNFRDEEFGTLEIEYLSAGTKDLAYIALRIALVKALYDSASRPPVVFDESLAFLDEARVKQAVELLEGENVQSLLFTCRSLESSVAQDAHVVTLAGRSPRRA